jgi:hypothetical protein
MDDNGQLYINFDVSEKIDPNCNIEFLDLEGNIKYLDGEMMDIPLTKVLPFKKSARSAGFSINRNVTNLSQELRNYQWTEIRYFLNFKINNLTTRTQELRYINQRYYKNKQDKITIRNFIKNAQTKKHSFLQK